MPKQRRNVQRLSSAARLRAARAPYVEVAGKAFEAAAKTVDARLKELTGYRDGLATNVARALDNPARRTAEGLSVASEVRAHTKGLSDAKRWAFVTEAVEAGDVATASAVLAAQPLLSGLSASQYAMVRELAANAQLFGTEAVLERVKDASQVLLGRYGKILELRNTPKAKADDGSRR